MFKKIKPGTTSRLTIVDHEETYGRSVLEKISKNWQVDTCVDLGCGHGKDLQIIKNNFPEARLFGVDFGDWNRDKLREKKSK